MPALPTILPFNFAYMGTFFSILLAAVASSYSARYFFLLYLPRFSSLGYTKIHSHRDINDETLQGPFKTNH